MSPNKQTTTRSIWVETQKEKGEGLIPEHWGTLSNKQNATVTIGKRKQVQQQTAREEKKEGLIPTQGVGGPQQGEMTTNHDIGTPMAANEEATEALAPTPRLRLKPPTYHGNYAAFEEWEYKFKAYMGIQDTIYPDLLSRAERAATVQQMQS